MKKIFKLLVMLMLPLASFSCFDDSSDDTPAGPSGPAVVCLGDSLTAGCSATTLGVDDTGKAWPAVLQTKLNATVINAGVTGDTTADALARLQTDVIAKDPKVVIICLGGNDFLEATAAQLTAGTTVNNIKTGLTSIIQALDTTERLVVIAKFYNTDVAMAVMDDSQRTLLGFNTLGLDDTQKTGIISAANTMYSEIESLSTTNIELMVIDGLWTNVWGTDKMSLDGIHPLAAGHTIMADNYFNAIKTILGEFGLVK